MKSLPPDDARPHRPAQPKTVATHIDAAELVEESLDILVSSGMLDKDGGPQRIVSKFPAQVTRVAKFVEMLAASHILNDKAIVEIVSRLGPDDFDHEAETLARELVEKGTLTEYQASILIRGDTEGLSYGEFIALENLGSGGMAMVLKAKHRGTKRIVALKVLSAEAANSGEGRNRFLRESETLRRLNHPNVVAIYESHQLGEELLFLAMEYVDGPDLADLVRKSGPLPIPIAMHYVLQAAQGLEYAHSQGVIHRDVKPDNLLVDSQGVVKILDLGLVRLEEPIVDPNASSDTKVNPGPRLTSQGAVLGTPNYMAPEQFLDPRSADPKADIYALGYTLYFMVTGKRPYVKPTPMETLKAHLTEAIPALNDGRDDVPDSVNAIYQKMVAKQPRDRYQSMAEVIKAIHPPEPSKGGFKPMDMMKRLFGKGAKGEKGE